jgi:hypothetical protein
LKPAEDFARVTDLLLGFIEAGLISGNYFFDSTR